jgi:hypothetical protein
LAIFNHNHRIRFAAAILSLGLLILSGCKRNSTDAAAINKGPSSGMSRPVRVSSGEVDAAEPAIAAAPDGTVYVAWVNHGLKSQADVMIAQFTGDGRMQGPAVRVNPQPDIATAWRGDPPTVAIAPDQTVFVGWTARVQSEAGHATDLYLSSSRDRGRTFSAPVKVNDDAKPAVHGMHSLAIGDDGRIYVAWLDERNIAPLQDMKMNAKTAGSHMESNREVFISSSTDGGRTFAPNQRVATEACPCCKTALAVAPDGRPFVGWRQVLPGDLRHIAVASSADQGKTFAPAKIVGDDQWVLAGCPVSGPSLSVDKNGVLRVLWYSAGSNGKAGLYWSQSKDQGASFAPRVLLADGPARGTATLAGQGDRLAAAWEGNEDSTAKVMTTKLAAGDSSADSKTVIASGEVPAAVLTGDRLLVAYIATIEQRQDVWLVSVPR